MARKRTKAQAKTTKTTKAQRQVVDEIFTAVEAGESYTLLKDGQPAAIILPIADWHALQGQWLDLLKPMRATPTHPDEHLALGPRLHRHPIRPAWTVPEEVEEAFVAPEPQYLPVDPPIDEIAYQPSGATAVAERERQQRRGAVGSVVSPPHTTIPTPPPPVTEHVINVGPHQFLPDEGEDEIDEEDPF